MIKRITDLEEMKRIVEVGDKIELPRNSIGKVGIIVNKEYERFNVWFKDNKYFGDDNWRFSLSELINDYYMEWNGEIALIKEIEDRNPNPHSNFDSSIGSVFKIYVEPSGMDCYCGKATLLNFNPNGQSVFLDKNNKLLIVRTNEIKYMKCIDK